MAMVIKIFSHIRMGKCISSMARGMEHLTRIETLLDWMGVHLTQVCPHGGHYPLLILMEMEIWISWEHGCRVDGGIIQEIGTIISFADL